MTTRPRHPSRTHQSWQRHCKSWQRLQLPCRCGEAGPTACKPAGGDAQGSPAARAWRGRLAFPAARGQLAGRDGSEFRLGISEPARTPVVRSRRGAPALEIPSRYSQSSGSRIRHVHVRHSESGIFRVRHSSDESSPRDSMTNRGGPGRQRMSVSAGESMRRRPRRRTRAGTRAQRARMVCVRRREREREKERERE